MKIFIEDPSEWDLKGMLWSGAEKNLEEIIDADRYDDFVNYIEEMYDDGIGLTELNDVLRFDFDQVKKDIGIFSLEDEVDVKALKKMLDDLEDWKKPRMITNSDMAEYEGLTDGSVSESDLSEQIDEINDKLTEVCDAIDSVLDSDDMDELESAKDDLESAYSDLVDVVGEYVETDNKVYNALMDYDISDFFYNI